MYHKIPNIHTMTLSSADSTNPTIKNKTEKNTFANKWEGKRTKKRIKISLRENCYWKHI